VMMVVVKTGPTLGLPAYSADMSELAQKRSKNEGSHPFASGSASPLSAPKEVTLLDVMIAVGGLTDFAAGNSATILRGGATGTQYSVRLKDLIKRGDVSANVEMRPGDILIIPQSFF